MHSFGKMLKALPHHSRDRSRSRERAKSPLPQPAGQSAFGETTASRPKWNLAGQKTDPVITIKPASPGDSLDGSFHVNISCPQIDFAHTAQMSPVFDAELQENVRWFIEDFHRLDVLNRERALNTRIAVRKACEQFVKELRLDEVLEKLTSDVRTLTGLVILEIEDNLSRKGTLFKLPWEMLEHPSLWPEGTKYDDTNAKQLGFDVLVKRKATATKKPESERRAKNSDGVYKFEVSFSVGTVRDLYPTYNILIVSNRDTSDVDDADSHFQIARPLCAALSSVDEAIHINIEICRPGSWDALQKYITGRRKGFWNVVHLDMPVGQSFFHFHTTNSSNYYDDVLDYEVAELLHKHEVSTVFLTCNEAKPNSTQESTALAASFVAEGIPVVVSAPYRLPKIYLMLLSSGFYQSILALHRKGPTYAAHVARKAMQTQEVNHTGRYLIPVKNTMEGLGVVVYDNGTTDDLNIKQFCYADTEKTPKRFGIAYQDAWLFGRDLDMMRLENKLLSNPPLSNIQWIAGKKSVGKNTVLSHLTYWWALTKFIQTSVYIDLGQCLDNFGGVLAQFATVIPTVGLGETYAEKYIEEVKTAKGGEIKKTKVYKDLTKLLRAHRIYLYVDNVDFWRPVTLEKTATSEVMCQEQKKLFLDFLEEVRGGLSFILLVCPWNDRSIRVGNPVFELKPLQNHDIQQMYGISEWDKWVEGTSSISAKQTMFQQETAREITQFHDAIVECSQGLMAAKQQFVYNLPFDTEQRTRDIFILLHANQASTAGPYNMENSPSAMLVEHLYDLIIRDRNDLEDKSPDANPNILRLMFALAPFFGRIPKDIKYYLVLLWHYGFFTSEWRLAPDQHDYQSGNQDEIFNPDDFLEALSALEDSPMLKEWEHLMQILVGYDYASHDGDEYYTLNPTVTFCIRKIVFASDGPLTTPILPLAIRLASQDFHMHRYKTINYGLPFDETCKTVLEKHTLFSQVLSAVMSCESTPLKALHLLVSSPVKVFFTQQMKEGVLTDADRRVVLHLCGCIANAFDSFISPNSYFSANPSEFDGKFFYEFWKLAYICAERISIYHNGSSHLADLFDIGVGMMRRCRAFGRRYDEERRREDNMEEFDDSLRAAESVREELVSLGVLKDEGGEDGIEPPPAYEPGEADATEDQRGA